jgi:hypothetical protein
VSDTLSILKTAAEQGAMAAPFLRGGIDLLKAAIDPPRWLAPTLAVVCGPLLFILVGLAGATSLDSAFVAQSVLSGLVAGAVSILGAILTDREKHED